jgi:hypothetical protein
MANLLGLTIQGLEGGKTPEQVKEDLRSVNEKMYQLCAALLFTLGVFSASNLKLQNRVVINSDTKF